MKKAFFTLLCSVLLPGLVFAQSEFTIATLVGDDLIPPTTPTLLSVVPTAPTQIDISWSTATDNFLLGGYVLLRDGTPLATTTLTMYADTGLIPETLYSYEVYAFDSFGNISTTSNAISTTTPAVPVVPPTPTSTPSTGTTGTLVFRLQNFDIIPASNSAVFAWQTSKPAGFILRWGRNDAYDAGYIVNDTYRKEHQTLISDLEPGAVYLYELVAIEPSGRQVILKSGEFRTIARESLIPANVQNLEAVVLENDVALSWVLPQMSSTPTVRVVRSHLGYPTDPYDGAIVYQGNAASFLDEGALVRYPKQYYSVFVVAEDGSVSSGAVVAATKKLSGGEVDPLPIEEEEEISIPDFEFSVVDIVLAQKDQSFSFGSEKIVLNASEPFSISIKKEALPDSLKSIIVTLLDPSDASKSYSFLLRINKDRTAYEAVLAALGDAGVSRLQVEVYDYERQVIGRYRKQIDFVTPDAPPLEVVFPDKLFNTLGPLFVPLLLILVAGGIFFFLLYRRSRKAEDNL